MKIRTISVTSWSTWPSIRIKERHVYVTNLLNNAFLPLLPRHIFWLHNPFRQNRTWIRQNNNPRRKLDSQHLHTYANTSHWWCASAALLPQRLRREEHSLFCLLLLVELSRIFISSGIFSHESTRHKSEIISDLNNCKVVMQSYLLLHASSAQWNGPFSRESTLDTYGISRAKCQCRCW